MLHSYFIGCLKRVFTIEREREAHYVGMEKVCVLYVRTIYGMVNEFGFTEIVQWSVISS